LQGEFLNHLYVKSDLEGPIQKLKGKNYAKNILTCAHYSFDLDELIAMFWRNKATILPDWIYMRVVPLDTWIGLINRYRFFIFFIFDLEFLIRVQSSEPLHAKMNPTSCFFGSRFACAQTAIFSSKSCSKNA
jgi:hypothetical protein